MLLNSL